MYKILTSFIVNYNILVNFKNLSPKKEENRERRDENESDTDYSYI